MTKIDWRLLGPVHGNYLRNWFISRMTSPSSRHTEWKPVTMIDHQLYVFTEVLQRLWVNQNDIHFECHRDCFEVAYITTITPSRHRVDLLHIVVLCIRRSCTFQQQQGNRRWQTSPPARNKAARRASHWDRSLPAAGASISLRQKWRDARRLSENMTSSTKPEVHNVLRCHRRTESRPRVKTYRNCREIWTTFSINSSPSKHPVQNIEYGPMNNVIAGYAKCCVMKYFLSCKHHACLCRTTFSFTTSNCMWWSTSAYVHASVHVIKRYFCFMLFHVADLSVLS